MNERTRRGEAKAKVAVARHSAGRSRLVALCAVALISISGSLLMQLGGALHYAGPLSVGWMFGPAGSVSVR